MHLSRFRTMATCERILMALSLKILWQGLWQVVSVGAVEPVDLVHFAYHDKLVTVTAHSAVIVKAIGLLRIAANHVRRLEHHAGYRVVVAAAGLGGDRKSTRLNSSHVRISYAVFCLKKKKRTLR